VFYNYRNLKQSINELRQHYHELSVQKLHIMFEVTSVVEHKASEVDVEVSNIILSFFRHFL